MILTEVEIDTLGEIGNISMGASATVLYELIGKRVSITTPKVTVTDMERLTDEYRVSYVIVDIKFNAGVTGHNILVMKQDDVMVLTDLVMGGDGTSTEGELDEIRLSAISEIMNQMIGSSSTSLSNILNSVVDIEPPVVTQTKFSDISVIDKEKTLVKISFKMEIEGLLNSELMQIMPVDFAKDLVRGLLNEQSEVEEMPEKNLETRKQINIEPLNLPSFDEEENIKIKDSKNIDILLDVPLPITVELGKSKKTIKEIVDLSEGSIVVLDKLAGDLVDVVVNGKLIAKGEVVIIDDNYGVRITELAEGAKGELR